VVAVLQNDPSHPDRPPSLLLQKQFRPALGKVTVESPSGLVDAGESPSQTAVRELHEETGYIGTVPSGGAATAAAEGMIMFNDPGTTNTNTKMIVVDVDMADPRNQNPKPELEEGEFIESFTLPLSNLWGELTRMEREGYAIDARVAGLAQGLEMAKMWKHLIVGDGPKANGSAGGKL
jgi:ADP-ribose pyrophosphatase